MSDLIGEIGFVLICVILAVTIIPLFLGVCIAVALDLTGLMYYVGVLGFACIIWFILCLLWW